jgi:hypothetical protein
MKRSYGILLPTGGRMFSVSAVFNMLSSHKLFTRVDWDKIEAGNYAVVDPVNPSNILYLAEQDYVIMVRVSLTTNRTLKVLAQPGDVPPSIPSHDNSADPNSKNSPVALKMLREHPWLSALLPRKGRANKARKQVKYLFHSPFANPHWREKGSEESMIKIHQGNLLDWLRIWYNKVHFWSRGSLPTAVHVHERNAFGHTLRRIIATQGLSQVIVRMKISLFVLNSYLGGIKMSSTEGLGTRIRLVNGLPRALPLYARNAIRSRSLAWVRLWATIFNSYKGFEGKWGLPPLGAITQPHPNLELAPCYKDFLQYISIFWRTLRGMGANLRPNFSIRDLFWTSKAGPNHPNSVLGSGIDAYAWTLQPKNWIREWLSETGQKELLLEFRKISKMVPLLQFTGLIAAKPVYRSNGTIKKWLPVQLSELVLGRLHALYEPAGKVRVVAIVDYWTQACLKPVHDWMFSVLRLIPTDATFDQEGKVASFAAKGFKEIYSLDLKSATDTIPMDLYINMLRPVFGDSLVNLWKHLLVDRDFLKPKELRDDNAFRTRLHAVVKLGVRGLLAPLLSDQKVRYMTGQPMGALSSWSSMALVHHLLVQYSAYTVCGDTGWFMAYLVLGDDVVIADKLVAERYQSILASFGITVGLAKSYISKEGMFNFANQSYIGEDNISPLSLREEVGIDSLPARAEMALRAVRRGWIDLSRGNWLGPLLKQFVTPQIYREAITDLRKGDLHPVCSWVTSTLFCPGVTRFSSLGIREVSINTFLACLTRKVSLWNKSIATLNSEVRDTTREALIVDMIGKSSDRLYKEFLRSREQLKDFEKWLIGQTSVSVEYVLKDIFSKQREGALARWSKDYREFVKTLQVLGRMRGLSVFLIEHTLNMYIDEAIRILNEAEQAIPRIPDFSSEDVSALTRRSILSEDSLEKFLKVAKLLGTIEGVTGTTPGRKGRSSILFGNEGIPTTPGYGSAYPSPDSERSPKRGDQNKETQ